MKKFKAIMIFAITIAVFLSSTNISYAIYDTSTGRFNQMDPFSGRKEEPQSLHKYAYCQNDPINKVDPTGMEGTATEVSVATAIQVNIGASIAINGFLLKAYLENKTYQNRKLSQQEINSFVQTNPQPFTQNQFEQLENRIKARTRNQQKELLYLHYSYENERSSLLQGLYPGSYATRDVYATGWQAKWNLSLPGTNHNGEPPDSVYFVFPQPRYGPTTGPTVITSKKDVLGRIMAGGGQQYIFGNGSGGYGTVSGPLRIAIGSYGNW